MSTARAISVRRERRFSALVALGFVGSGLALVVLAIAMFRQDFRSTEPLRVESSRAGLMMGPGALVKLRGVEIGKVSRVRSVNDRAVLDLAIDTRYLDAIPSNVGANIVPNTVFGNKYVELTTPSLPAPAIAAGATIRADHVTVEVNDTFTSVTRLLNAVKPRQINAALGALATSLSGNGADAGELITQVNAYLGQINPMLPTIDSDIVKGATVSGTYADLAPNLVAVARNSSSISDTVVANRATLDALLVSFTRLADSTDHLLDSNEGTLHSALAALEPTTRLLAKYAPEFPCLFGGLAEDSRLATPVFGSPRPGINAVLGLLPADDPYQPYRDLPEVRATGGPACYGLPRLQTGTVPRHEHFDMGGVDPYAGDHLPAGGIAGTPGGAPGVYLDQFFGTLVGVGSIL